MKETMNENSTVKNMNINAKEKTELEVRRCSKKDWIEKHEMAEKLQK